MKETLKITRRIQIFVDSKDRAFIKQTYEELKRWRYICFRCANYLITHQFVQDQLRDMIYLTEDMRVRLADVKKNPNGMLVTSQANSTYRLLGSYFKGRIPMPIISCLNRALVNTFFKKVDRYRQGEESLPNYRQNLPIPFNAENLRRLAATLDGKEFTFKLFSIPFRTYLSRDQGEKRDLLRRVVDGKVKFCSSAIKLDKTKLYLLASFEIEQERHLLNDEVIAEATLSLDYPVMVKIGKFSYTIGSKEEFLHRRVAIQAARNRVRKAVQYCRGKNGLKRKQKGLEDYRHAEKRHVDYKLHAYSRKLINLCLKHQAATLILVAQRDKEEAAKQDQFLLRHWTASGLREKIQYKADRVGITVICE